EDCARAAGDRWELSRWPLWGCTIEVPICGLNKRGEWVGAAPTTTEVVQVEAVQRGHRAVWSDFEDRAVAVAVVPARLGCPVEVPVGGLNQSTRALAVNPPIEAVQRGQRAAWCDFENSAIAIAVGPAAGGCPVEVPVSSLNQPSGGALAVSPIEAV